MYSVIYQPISHRSQIKHDGQNPLDDLLTNFLAYIIGSPHASFCRVNGVQAWTSSSRWNSISLTSIWAWGDWTLILTEHSLSVQWIRPSSALYRCVHVIACNWQTKDQLERKWINLLSISSGFSWFFGGNGFDYLIHFSWIPFHLGSATTECAMFWHGHQWMECASYVFNWSLSSGSSLSAHHVFHLILSKGTGVHFIIHFIAWDEQTRLVCWCLRSRLLGIYATYHKLFPSFCQ